MDAPRPAALIFRKRILPWSETFIGAQAGAMTRYAPVLAGYHRDSSGAALVAGIPCVLLDEQSAFPPLEKLLLKQFGRLPRRWMRAIAAFRPCVVHAHFGSSVVPGRRIARCRIGCWSGRSPAPLWWCPSSRTRCTPRTWPSS